MLLQKFFKLACASLILIQVFPSETLSDPTDFFPSVPIHEDDSFTSELELRASGCSFEINEYWPSRSAPRSISRTNFDLTNYDTDVNRVHRPPNKPKFSTRHLVVWFAEGMSNADLEHVKGPLRNTRLTLTDRRNIDAPEAREKQSHLKSLLAQIEAGGFGTFPARNHQVDYAVRGSKPEIISVSVNIAFRLLVTGKDGQRLIEEMNEYRLKHCPKSQPITRPIANASPDK